MHTVVSGLPDAVCIPHGFHSSCTRRVTQARGFTLLETMVVTFISATIAAAAIPSLVAAAQDIRTASAARYLVTRLQQMRSESIARSVNVGWAFVSDRDGYQYRQYLDGNANGIRTDDIRSGADPGIGLVERLGDRYAGVEFGVLPDLPAVDGNEAAGPDPIKLGAGNILTFSPLGTSSSGSLYILGPRNRQYAICVLGETGRIRALRFDARSRKWMAA
jgi:prepilin-type N-terminal cleavage/methylation domain-containing protein